MVDQPRRQRQEHELPVAELAVNMPTTRPRRATNQRVAMIAPSTRAVIPVPMPTTMPHSSTRCYICVITSASKSPETMSVIAAITIRRTP